MAFITAQNPNLVTTGGFENTGKSLYPNTSIGFSIPVFAGKFYHGLKESEIEKVEEYYGCKFDSPEGRDLFGTLSFKIPDSPIGFDLDTPDQLLSYRLAVSLGIIAETKSDTEDPLNSSYFYIVNSKLEEELNASINEIEGEVIADLTIMKRKEKDKLIKLSKYLFETYDILDENKAYNKIFNFVKANTKSNNNIEIVKAALDLDEEEINLVVDIKEAISRSILAKNNKGFYYNKVSSTELGKNLEEIKLFLLQNSDELGTGGKDDSVYSIRRQLKG